MWTMTLWFGHVSPRAPDTTLSYAHNQTIHMKGYDKLKGHWQLTECPRLKSFNQTLRLEGRGPLPPPQVVLPRGRFKSSTKHWLFILSRNCPNLSSSFLAEVGAPSSVSIKFRPHMAISTPGSVSDNGLCSPQFTAAHVLCQAVSSKGSAAVIRAPSGARGSVHPTLIPSSLPPWLSASFPFLVPLSSFSSGFYVFIYLVPSFLP